MGASDDVQGAGSDADDGTETARPGGGSEAAGEGRAGRARGASAPGGEPGKTAKARVRDQRERASEAFRVAKLAWAEGLAANTIAERTGLPIMRVKRALKFAQRENILTLHAPPELTLADQLEQQYPATRFTVVREHADGARTFDPIALEAARVATAVVQQLVKRPGRSEVIVANAGGRSVAHVVRYLRDIVRLTREEYRKLLFLSLHCAGAPDAYNISANALAVGMGEVFRARHLAALEVDSDPERYAAKVPRIDLLICGAGSREGFLAEYLRAKKVGEIDPRMVGDIAFHPLDENGDRIRLSPEGESAIACLRPQPPFEQLLVRGRRILLVLTQSQEDDRRVPAVAPDGAGALVPSPGSSKLPVARAILRKGLVTDAVLGSSLAHQLVDAE